MKKSGFSKLRISLLLNYLSTKCATLYSLKCHRPITGVLLHCAMVTELLSRSESFTEEETL